MPKKKFPDPKVWKWCKDEECLEQARKLPGFGSGGFKEQELMRKLAVWCAVLGEDYCWKHLSVEAKVIYKAKIEGWASQRHSLEGTNLSLANLHKVNLQEANLKKTSLYGVNLQEANLEEANLQGADLNQAELQNANLAGAKLQNALLYLANLQNANLGEAELQKAFLREAKLQKTRLGRTNFQNADLSDAKLQEAYLGGTNFQNADLEGVELNGAFLYAVELDEAKRLTWNQLKKHEDEEWAGKVRVGEENERNWKDARDAYRRLKNYFHQQGRYDDEVRAYYREKLMAKKAAFAEKKRWRGFTLALSQVLTGFGEHWWKTALWALGVIGAFWITYWIIGAATGHNVFHFSVGSSVAPMWLQYLYFSVISFATLGFGDIAPKCAGVQILVIFEVIMGYVFLGLIITIIARRFGR